LTPLVAAVAIIPSHATTNQNIDKNDVTLVFKIGNSRRGKSEKQADIGG
jgi:hypothetical protein